MTIEEFAQATEWPIDELYDADLSEVYDIMELYGLQPMVMLDAQKFWLLLSAVPKAKLNKLIELLKSSR